MSSVMLDRLKSGLGAEDDQIYRVNGPLDLADAEQLLGLDRPELKLEPWVPVTQARVSPAVSDTNFFDEVARGATCSSTIRTSRSRRASRRS